MAAPSPSEGARPLMEMQPCRQRRGCFTAPPASHNANLEPLIEGPAISLAARHAKVRREGYVK